MIPHAPLSMSWLTARRRMGREIVKVGVGVCRMHHVQCPVTAVLVLICPKPKQKAVCSGFLCRLLRLDPQMLVIHRRVARLSDCLSAPEWKCSVCQSLLRRQSL